MRKDTSVKYVPKYYHKDGNGIHLLKGKTYDVIYENRKCQIRILSEYRHFYLVIVNDTYKTSINKYYENLKFI